MNRRLLPGLLLFLLVATSFAMAGPRDAAAVLNRCGKPLKGDETILEDTVTGGRRILNYERGEIHFDKVANVGWTFAYGTHRKKDHLNAREMETYMPCLKDALAESASLEPLVLITPAERVEVSVKRSFKTLILYTFAGLVVIGLVLLGWSRRARSREDAEEGF
jgi:hypothetical protein